MAFEKSTSPRAQAKRSHLTRRDPHCDSRSRAASCFSSTEIPYYRLLLHFTWSAASPRAFAFTSEGCATYFLRGFQVNASLGYLGQWAVLQQFRPVLCPFGIIFPFMLSIPGWTSSLKPANHPLSSYDFDVIVGADGKRNTLQG